MVSQASFTLSQHVRRRMSERNICGMDFDFLMRYGESLPMHGYEAWYLPHEISWAPPRLFKLVVITTTEGHIVTAYRTNGSVRRLIEKLIQKPRRLYVCR